jgi:tripartite-type tricarboxylate transporter receptor subunit TctC
VVAALVAGHVMIGISSLPPAVEQIKEGSLRALALTTKTRSHKLPDIPTVAEAGYPILEGDQWLGVFVPIGTPKEIITTLHRKIDEFVAQADMKEHLETLDFYRIGSTPEEFAERIKAELARWRDVIRTANIKAA